jgi:hypothetical protein
MAVIPVFHGHVTPAGDLVLREDERALRRAYLRVLAGKSIDLLMRRHREKRTLDQNAYLHAVPFPILAEYFGDDIESTKLVVLGARFGWKRTADGHEVPIKAHTSDLSVEETSDLIEWLPPWAMTNFRVEIPLPDKGEAA